MRRIAAASAVGAAFALTVHLAGAQSPPGEDPAARSVSARAPAAGRGFEQSPSAAEGLDLDAAVAAAEAMPRLHSLLVSRGDGVVLLERYFNGKDQADIANIKSVSKSVISALVGIAISEGHIDGVTQPIGDYFGAQLSAPQHTPKKAITIEHLLTMQSGLETTSNRNYGAWVMSPDWVEYALRQPLEVTPGTRMVYSTGNTHLLSAILTRVTGRDTLTYAREVLARPLGFHLASWPKGPRGIYFGGNDMEMTPRQMLAFGRLYLNGGRAGGRQVVPEPWVEASLQPRAESTRERERYYGYGWWIRETAGLATPYAWGYGGQFIVLVPDLDLVVVTTSASSPGSERRGHRRLLYDMIEDLIIAPLGAESREAGRGYSSSASSAPRT